MLELLVSAIVPLINKFVPDKDRANELAYEIATLTEKQAHEISKLQIETNKTEAAHKSIFVSGWRPFTGWVCSVSLAFNFIGLPILNYIGNFYSIPTVPSLDMSTMLPVLLGMLGLGTMRSFEKHKGVAREK